VRSNDLHAFRELLGSIYVLYRADLSDAVADIWWRALKPYNLSDVKEALDAHTTNSELGQFCPKPADLIKFILAKAKPTSQLCWHCQADLVLAGRTRLRMGDVCNPCYKTYLNGEWSIEGKAA